jgi:anti-sigma factor RsiW
MATCTKVYQHICESLDEDLDTPRCRAIKRHIESCPNCRTYMASLKKTIRLYRSLPIGSTPRVAHARLAAALESEMRRRQEHPTTRRRRPS